MAQSENRSEKEDDGSQSAEPDEESTKDSDGSDSETESQMDKFLTSVFGRWGLWTD